MAANNQPTHDQFHALILRHRDLIERLCMRRAAGDYHRCAELRQNCYISIWRHAASLRPDATPLQETLWVVWQCRSVFSRLRFLRRSAAEILFSIVTPYRTAVKEERLPVFAGTGNIFPDRSSDRIKNAAR